MNEESLVGGVANAGAVVRRGGHVLRPASPYTPSIHRFLASLRAEGFGGASVPVGVDDDGRERLVFIEGDVAVPPYPPWAQTDQALISIAKLLRAFHGASGHCDPTGLRWSEELADPAGGSVVCHNDICLENVVFRDGVAVGLVDFDFAAPGRPLYDVAQFARMCVPIDDDLSAARLGWTSADRAFRLRTVADTCGSSPAERLRLLGILDDVIARGGAFVQKRVQAGDQNFIRMWNAMGGMERFDRRRRWWADHKQDFARVMS